MDPRPELRREPPADLSDVGSDEALVGRIRDEIGRDGPMPFAREARRAVDELQAEIH